MDVQFSRSGLSRSDDDAGQSVQLGYRGSQYSWTPPQWLDRPNVQSCYYPRAISTMWLVPATARDVPRYGYSAYTSTRARGLYVPQCISPDGNGLNDELKPIKLGYELREIPIFKLGTVIVFICRRVPAGMETATVNHSPGGKLISGTPAGKRHPGTGILLKGSSILLQPCGSSNRSALSTVKPAARYFGWPRREILVTEISLGARPIHRLPKRTAAKTLFVHLHDHIQHTVGVRAVPIGEAGPGEPGGNKQHGGRILAGGNAGRNRYRPLPQNFVSPSFQWESRFHPRKQFASIDGYITSGLDNRSNAVRSTTGSLTTGKALARQGFHHNRIPSLKARICNWRVVVPCQGPWADR